MPSLQGSGRDPAHRAENHARPQGVALEAAAQLRKSQRHRSLGSRRPVRQTHHEAAGPPERVYREQLREILERKQINVVAAMLWQWCTNIMRYKVEPMKEVAKLIRNHFDGIIAWSQTRQTNGFLEALNGLFKAAKCKARGYDRFSTINTVIFLIAGKLDFSKLNPHVAR